MEKRERGGWNGREKRRRKKKGLYILFVRELELALASPPCPCPHLTSAALPCCVCGPRTPFPSTLSLSVSPFSSSSISSNKNDKISSIYYCVLYLPLYSTWYVYMGRYRGTDTARACVGSILHSNITRTCMVNNIVPVNT